MFQAQIRIKEKCSKHPRFSPARTGLGSAHAGCMECFRISQVYSKVLEIRRLLGGASTIKGLEYGKQHDGNDKDQVD